MSQCVSSMEQIAIVLQLKHHAVEIITQLTKATLSLNLDRHLLTYVHLIKELMLK